MAIKINELHCFYGNQRNNTALSIWQLKQLLCSCGINFENLVMYPRWRLAVQNIYNLKITKLADMWEEMKVFVKNWEGSAPQSVTIATVKTC